MSTFIRFVLGEFFYLFFYFLTISERKDVILTGHNVLTVSLTLIITRKRGCGKVMFSVRSVCSVILSRDGSPLYMALGLPSV